MSKCNEVLNHIYEYMNTHDITPEMNVEIRQHLEFCRGCFTRYEFEQHLLEKFKKSTCCSCPDSLKKKIQGIMELF